MSNFAYLLLAFLCILLHPSTGVPRRLAADAVNRCPIFIAASGSVAVFYFCAQRAASTHMDERILFLPCLLASASVFRSTMRAPCWKRSSITNPISRGPKCGIERNHNRGEAANTDHSNQRCRWRGWLSRFISPTSFGSRLSMDSSFRYPSCSCFRPVFFMSVSLPWQPLANRFWQLAGGRRNFRVTKFVVRKNVPMFRPLAVIVGLISVAPAFRCASRPLPTPCYQRQRSKLMVLKMAARSQLSCLPRCSGWAIVGTKLLLSAILPLRKKLATTHYRRRVSQPPVHW